MSGLGESWTAATLAPKALDWVVALCSPLERLGYGLVGHLASSTVDRGGVDSSVDHRSGNGVSSVDNRGGVDGMMGDRVDRSGVDGVVSHRVDSVVDWGVDGMTQMRSMRGVGSQDNTSVADGSVAANIRGGSSSSKTEQGGNDESLKYLSVN